MAWAITTKKPNLMDWFSRRALSGFALVLMGLLAAPTFTRAKAADSIRWWVSTGDLKQQLVEQPPLEWQTAAQPNGERIRVNPAMTFQTRVLYVKSLPPGSPVISMMSKPYLR